MRDRSRQVVWTAVFCVTACIASFVVSCTNINPEFENVHRVAIEYWVEPDRCRCDGAEAVFIKNHGKRTGIVTWAGTRTDSGGTTPIGDTLEVAPGQFSRIGCTKRFLPTCEIEYSYRLVQVSSKLSSQSGLDVLSAPAQSRLEACAELCDERLRGCLRFGRGALKVVTPINQLYSSAIAEGRDSIPNAEILSRYGISNEEDGCKRGDTLLSADGWITNTAEKGCTIKAFDYLATTMGVEFADARELSDLVLLVPEKINGKREEMKLARGGTARVAVFEDDEQTVQFKFTGAEAERFNDLYGGRVQQVGLFGDRIILSTTRGCVSVPVSE